MACIAQTLKSEQFTTYPYLSTVPSFGVWGFVLAARESLDIDSLTMPVETQYLTAQILPKLFDLPADIKLGGVEINRLTRPVIVQYQNEAKWLNEY